MTDSGASSLNREDLHALFQSVPWPVVVFHGPDHIVELVNDEFLRLASARRGPVIGKPFGQAFPDLDALGMRAALDQVFRTGEPHVSRGFRAVIAHADRPTEGYWDLTIQAVHDARGRVIGVLGCSIEVTEQVRAVERMKVLADSGLLLDDELDLERTLHNLAELLVPSLADYCIVDLLEGNRLHRALAVHANPAKRDLIARLRAFDPDPSVPAGVATILANGEPVLATTIRPENLASAAREAEHLAILQALDPRSSILFPLRARGAVLGLLTVAYAESGRRYGKPDLQLVGDLAQRAAVAISATRAFLAERRATERITRLQAVTSELANASTFAAVADIILREGCRSMGASVGVLQLLDRDRTHLELVSVYGISPEGEPGWRRNALSMHTPLTVCARTGQPVFVESSTEWRREFPTAAATPIGPAGARAALPLLIHGLPIGAVSFSFDHDHVFEPEEREFIAALVGHGALALERARLFDASAAAREAAEAAVARITRLQRLTSALSMAVTVQDAAQALIDEGMAALGAGAGGVWLIDSDPRTLELVYDRGFGEHAAGLTRFHLDDPIPVADALRAEAPIFLCSPAERVRLYPHVGDGARAGFRAWAAIPLMIQGRVIGGLSFSFAQERIFSAADQELMMAMANQAAQAIERARLYEAVVERERQAKLAEQRKDEFLAMLGHELRNPLAPIRTGLELVRLKGGRSFDKECAILDRQVTHLTRLVDDLLDVSRITRGKIELKRECQELGLVIGRGVEIARPLIDSRKHQLTIHVPASGLLVDVDAVRLAQVISNLLTNAARYTPPGGQLAIEARREGAWVLIRVVDNGIGIPEHLLSAVFDLFVQGDRRLDRSEGGLGIGLTLARSVVELHGGTIEAFSKGPGQGAELVIRLPSGMANEVCASEPIQVGNAAADRPVRRKRILVVDDNVDAAAMLADLLATAGHDVATAHDGEHALLVAAEFRPELALLDIGLPGLDGFELAGRFRQDPVLATIRLVAVTGYGQVVDRARGRAAGFDEYCVKPVAAEALMRILQAEGRG